MKKEPKILVVDDQPINVRLLEKKLQRCGIRVFSAFSGPDALVLAKENTPDVILLDIMMPGMDGLEVCRRIKEDEVLCEIPVIFITAKTSKEGKIEGLGLGAADYITKPVDLDETVARINTQIRIQENHRVNLELSQRLAESRQHAAIAHVTEGIAHNLNNLLGVVVGYMDLLKSSINNPERLTRSCDQLDKAVKRIIDIVRELTTISQFDRVRKSPHPLPDLLASSLERFRKEHPVGANIRVAEPLPPVKIHTNAELFEDILGRLIINGWESYRDISKNPDGHVVEISARHIESPTREERPSVEITVADRGCGIPARIRESVFEPFVTTESAVGRGMGLTIVRHSIQSLGGSVGLKSRQGGGTVATLSHPVAPQSSEETAEKEQALAG